MPTAAASHLPPLISLSLAFTMQSSPPPSKSKTIITIPSSPPQLPSNPKFTGQKRFLDIEPSSDDLPVFSSDDLPPKEVFANPYHAYRSVRNVKRQRSGTLQSITFKQKFENAFLSSDQPDEDGTPSSSSKSKLASQDTVWSDGQDDDDEANTSMTTIVGIGSGDDYYPDDDILGGKVTMEKEDEAERKANLIIQTAIEEGSATVDLSNLSLKKVPSEISSLASLISQPKSELKASGLGSKSSSFSRSSSGIDPTVSTPFVSLRPQHRIYLNDNLLTAIPRSLTALSDAVVLSLRKNQLRSLPSHIGTMRSLTNVIFSNNCLAYLPFDLIQLENLESPVGIRTFPNPLFTFEGLNDQMSPPTLPDRDRQVLEECGVGEKCFMVCTHEGRISEKAIFPALQPPFLSYKKRRLGLFTFITSTPISVFNDMGQLVSEPLTSEIPYPSFWPTSDLTHTIKLPILSSPQEEPTKPHITKFPTLQELCLRTMASDPMYTTLKRNQREEIYASLPEHLEKKVYDILENRSSMYCSVCEELYVNKGAEWIEFWEVVFYDYISNDILGTDSCVSGIRDSTSYLHPKALEALLRAQRENPIASEKRREDAALVEDVLKATEPSNAFLKNFFGKDAGATGRRTVLPLLREACSWECAENWMEARMAAEADQMTRMTKLLEHQK